MICDAWRFHKSIVLAALTRFQALAFGVIVAESDRDALIRRLLCSAMCSGIPLLLRKAKGFFSEFLRRREKPDLPKG